MTASLPKTLLIPALVALLFGCSDTPPAPSESEFTNAVMQAEVPVELATGVSLFADNCSACHGERGLGTEQGPPLVHIIYEPSHHADVAFLMAVRRGVRAHHWQFGDMPPIPSLDNEDVAEIVAYIRFLQRHAGIV
ncbi:MAG: c-type cytochrome [Gemmatimonas sp.]|nr:c-type cytochrome [Gemmatimonas sp.]